MTTANEPVGATTTDILSGGRSVPPQTARSMRAEVRSSTVAFWRDAPTPLTNARRMVGRPAAPAGPDEEDPPIRMKTLVPPVTTVVPSRGVARADRALEPVQRQQGQAHEYQRWENSARGRD